MKKIAALQMLVNTIDPIIIKHNIIKHNVWELYCLSPEQHSSVVFFYEMNGSAYACLLLRRYRLRFLSQFLILSRFG
jgi:hypothetical protein